MVHQLEHAAAAAWKAHRPKPGRRGPRQGWPGRCRPAAQMGAGRRHSGPVSLFGPFYHRYLISALLLPGGDGTVALCFTDQERMRQHGSMITLMKRDPVLTDVRLYLHRTPFSTVP